MRTLGPGAGAYRTEPAVCERGTSPRTYHIDVVSSRVDATIAAWVLHGQLDVAARVVWSWGLGDVCEGLDAAGGDSQVAGHLAAQCGLEASLLVGESRACKAAPILRVGKSKKDGKVGNLYGRPPPH